MENANHSILYNSNIFKSVLVNISGQFLYSQNKIDDSRKVNQFLIKGVD